MHTDKASLGFIRAMARELLVHRTDLKDVNEAIEIASELIDLTHTHTVTGNDRRG
jgi:hypothetical protein